MRCSEIMTEDIIHCTKQTTMVGAASLMRNEDVGVLPVLDDDKKLIGLVTDRDIVVRGLAENLNPTNTAIVHIMSEDLITCRPNDEIEVAMQRMREAQIRRIPVVDGGNRLMGMIAQADIALRTERREGLGEVLEAVSQPA